MNLYLFNIQDKEVHVYTNKDLKCPNKIILNDNQLLDSFDMSQRSKAYLCLSRNFSRSILEKILAQNVSDYCNQEFRIIHPSQIQRLKQDLLEYLI